MGVVVVALSIFSRSYCLLFPSFRRPSVLSIRVDPVVRGLVRSSAPRWRPGCSASKRVGWYIPGSALLKAVGCHGVLFTECLAKPASSL